MNIDDRVAKIRRYLAENVQDMARHHFECYVPLHDGDSRSFKIRKALMATRGIIEWQGRIVDLKKSPKIVKACVGNRSLRPSHPRHSHTEFKTQARLYEDTPCPVCSGTMVVAH